MPWLQNHGWAEFQDSLWALEHADSPLTVLRAIVNLQRLLEVVIAGAVADARSQGATWEDIAGAMRLTRQAVHRRFASPLDIDE